MWDYPSKWLSRFMLDYNVHVKQSIILYIDQGGSKGGMRVGWQVRERRRETMSI